MVSNFRKLQSIALACKDDNPFADMVRDEAIKAIWNDSYELSKVSE